MVKSFILLITSLFILSSCSNEKVKIDETVKVNEENWEESATLVREIVVTDDGQIGDFIFHIGDNGRLGFGEYGPFIAGETQKYMWHFWDNKASLTKPFKVIGVSKETGEEIIVFKNPANSNLSPKTGPDNPHLVPSSMMLPTPGLWRLEVYFGEEIFGNVVVNVEDK